MRLKKLPPSQLDRLINANQPVYVLNTSALSTGDKGMIVVNFFDGNRREFFKMPPTFIPMAVSDAIPSSKLRDSRDFKQCLLKGMLTLVDPASAEDYLSTPEAQDEYESLVLSEHSAQYNNIDVEREVSRRTRVAHQTNDSHGPIQDVGAVDTISNKVRGLVESMVSESMTSKEALTQLRRHQSALKTVDFSYVIENSTDPALTKWAKKALKKATIEDDDDDDDFDDEEYEAKSVKAARKKKPAKIKKKATTRVKKESESFSFDSDDGKMSPEELAADTAAKQNAYSSQSTQGESQINDEINRMMKGEES